jgi:TM2 domain-containing membrane protein YozV
MTDTDHPAVFVIIFMATKHKNKTFATLLAFLLGGIGAHRFYLRGVNDTWGWVHAASVPAIGLVMAAAPDADMYFKLLPLIISMLAGFLQALVLGLMSDEKWDATFNAGSGRSSDTRWPLAVILVATMLVGCGSLIAAISRLFDLLYTGGAYG